MNRWTPIPDADRQSYVPTNLDRGMVLIVLVTGVVHGRPSQTYPNTKEAGTDPDRWYVTLPIGLGVFQDGSTPLVSHDGTPKVGEEITVQPVATRPLQDSWSYQWYADGALITGATSDSLVLAAAQRGKRITVRATARRSEFADRDWTSAPTPVVAGDRMESEGTPAILTSTGEPSVVVDQEVLAHPGRVCDVAEPSGGTCAGSWPLGTSFTYQWQRDGKNIIGATRVSYVPVTQDAGKQLGVVVAGSKPGYDPVSVTSAAVSVRGTPMLGAVPKVTGTPRVGERLTGSASGWSPPGSSLTYEWYAGNTLLQSGWSTSLTVPAKAAGKPIVLRVTGERTGYEPLTTSSEPTRTVAKGRVTPSTPTIYGTAKVGSTLMVSAGYWSPSGVKLRYQWKVGSRLVKGKAGTKPQFRIPRTARGKRIAVVVTATLAGYTTVKRTSRATAKVSR
ncbi:hypothetical protein [Nocardioides sp. TF02-7]|uniref:hypothetical protein n=1 Tax=Nocardioides sp. TF02-7 TaxID=2917724 RepID=UPI001F060CA2|nr:hypothetical protein [Nocardioides sp. TF02-7]UMG92048.1 hypothetical protein MF408_19045 [Nocardioides sp. TF02-7]